MLFQMMINLSLVFGMLFAPCLLLVSVWYRRNLGKTIFSWNKHEMVVLTIVFSVICLIHLIIGVSCLFSYLGYLDPIQLRGMDRSVFLFSGVICLSNIIGLTLCYFALRQLIVQLITNDGIVLNRILYPLSNRLKLLQWNQILDYYVVSDYPNAIFNFISKSPDQGFARNSIRVPIYLKDEFQTLINNRMGSEEERQLDAEISNHFSNEN